MDRHRLWRIVERNYREIEKDAPEGFETVCEVYLAGRTDPMVIGMVHTNRNPDDPWIMLHNMSADPSAADHANEAMVFVREEYIERVEIRYRRAKGPGRVGFAHKVTEDDGKTE